MAIEETMSRLAHSHVTQSLPSLTDDIQGFQLVLNDEDNNLVIGVVVALIEDTCIYIPTIYKEGKIYDMDIMYVPEIQQWLPTQDNWLSYLRSHKAGLVDMTKIPNKNSGTAASAVNLNLSFDKLVKTASGDVTRHAVFKAMPSIMKLASESVLDTLKAPVKGFSIPSFPEVMSKCAAQDATTILNTIAEYPSVSNAFVQFYTDKDLLDIATKTSARIMAPNKDQGAPKGFKGAVRVISVSSNEAKDLDHDAKVKLLRDGAVVVDERGFVPSKVYKTKANHEWTTASTYGLYELLKLDGSTITAIVIPMNRRTCFMGGYSEDTNNHNDVIVIPFEDFVAKKATVVANPPLGQRYPVTAPEIRINKNLADLCSDIQMIPRGEGRSYIIVHGEDVAFVSKPGWCAGNKYKASWLGDADGTSAMLVDPGLTVDVISGLESGRGGRCNSSRRVNRIEELPPRARIRLRDNILYVPKGSYVVDLDRDVCSEGNPLQLAAVEEVCCAVEKRNKLTKVKLFNDNNRITISVDDGEVTEPLGKTNAEYKLVKDFYVDPETAMEMVKEASEAPNNQCRYLIKVAAESAYASMLGEQPDSEDRLEDVDLNSVLPVADRKSLEVAGNSGIKDVLDVSVIKALSGRRSSVNKIQEYVPSLFSALDAVCRLLFMTRAGSTMDEAYGKSRSSELESQLAQLVGDLGDTIICLQQGRIDSVNNLLEGPLSDSIG